MSERTAEKDAAYPTRWPLIRMACRNHKCRVEVYAAIIVHPFNCCPLCGKEGDVIPPEGGAA